MAAPDEQALRAALRGIADPATGRDLVGAGLVEQVQSRDGLVHVSLLTDRAHAAAMEPVRREVETRLGALPGVRSVTAVLTAHKAAAASAPPQQRAAPAKPALLPEVGSIVAVASGKGGVGKSTVAVNLAVALSQLGLSVGLLDADIYGPSLPRMLGLSRRPEKVGDRIQPLMAWGLKTMSIGFLVEEETAMIWRGPMVAGALETMMGQVEWGRLDVLIVDMPPGTGDAQLTLAQKVALAGAVIVSTPQDIALLDARRGVRMFEKTQVPVLGLVENMSYFHCPACGHRAEIFGHGGARLEAKRLDVDFLGEIPLLLDIRTSGDAGSPIVASAPDSDGARAFTQVAVALRAKLAAARKVGPRIVIG